jgi:hypothetical protein
VDGQDGADGQDGDDGGLAGYEIVTGTAVAIAPDDWDVAVAADCPTGKLAIGGGAGLEDSSLDIALAASYPEADGSGWNVVVRNYDAEATSVTPYAVCAASA